MLAVIEKMTDEFRDIFWECLTDEEREILILGDPLDGMTVDAKEWYVQADKQFQEWERNGTDADGINTIVRKASSLVALIDWWKLEIRPSTANQLLC